MWRWKNSISSIVSAAAKGSQEAINNSDGYDKINSSAAQNRRASQLWFSCAATCRVLALVATFCPAAPLSLTQIRSPTNQPANPNPFLSQNKCRVYIYNKWESCEKISPRERSTNTKKGLLLRRPGKILSQRKGARRAEQRENKIKQPWDYTLDGGHVGAPKSRAQGHYMLRFSP